MVPSRVTKGHFYALPQSPQLYKQLLMIGGMEKYFQIARCFRDEDLRADRQPEFTQIDIEMSFANEENIWSIVEGLMQEIFKDIKNVTLDRFPRLKYSECMTRFGSDKPDTRFEMELQDITEILLNTDFQIFKDIISNKGIINAIVVKGMAEKFSRKDIDKLTDFVKIYGAKALSYLKYKDNEFSGSIVKVLSDVEKNSLIEKLNVSDNDLVFIIADKKSIVYQALGALRLKLGHELELIDKSKFEFCIVNDFPMFEYNEEDEKWDFGHNPFSMPKGGLEALKSGDIENIVAYQYDFVCNGNEMASGAVRNHDIEVMKEAFNIAGYNEEVLKNKFRSLYTAFQFGAPPHAGMAPGIDRIVMLLTEEENLREVQVFPPNVSGMDALMGSPNELTEQQLRELHIKVRD